MLLLKMFNIFSISPNWIGISPDRKNICPDWISIFFGWDYYFPIL